jgi:peroxiredoxin
MALEKLTYYLLILLIPFLFSFNVGEKVKPLELRDIDGNLFQLKDYCDKKKANVIIFDFFSTKCPQCERTIEVLKKVKEEYEGIEVFLISFQDRERKLREFFKKKGMPFRILMDKFGYAARDYGVISLPHTIILDGNCIWRYEIKGEQFDFEKELKEKIEKILEVKK